MSCNRYVVCMSVALLALAAHASFLPGTVERPFRGRESWACIKAHPAVVNPAVPAAAAADIVSLRGEWDFFSQKFFDDRNGIWAVPIDGGEDRWRSERCRRIVVPGCWEAQGVGSNAMSRPWVCSWDASPKPIRNAFWGEYPSA